jgi:hypothetical protein
MCRLVNQASASHCDCGHKFDGDAEELRKMLAYKLSVGWTTAVGGAFLVAVAFGIASVGVALAPPGTFILGVVLAIKGTHAIIGARRSRKELADRALPTARLVD